MSLKLIGSSKKIKQILEEIKIVAENDLSLLILGETGTGKGLLANLVHIESQRRNGIFCTVNSNISESLLESELFGHERGAFTGAIQQRIGKFEHTGNGTLFLDEIDSMNYGIQSKILRVIDTGYFERLGSNDTIKTNARIITATNADLCEKINNNSFREDLFYRISGFCVELPPLRERMEDIPELSASFVEDYSNSVGKRSKIINVCALEKLQQHVWPGNIRELKNVIQRAFCVSKYDEISDEHIHFSNLKHPSSAKLNGHNGSGNGAEKSIYNMLARLEAGIITPLREFEIAYKSEAMRITGGNISETAYKLGIGRSMLYRNFDFSKKEK